MAGKFTGLLSNRLLIASLLSVLFVSLALTTVVGFMVVDHNRTLILSNQKSFTDLVANRIDAGLSERFAYLETLSEQLIQNEELISANDIKYRLDSTISSQELFNNGVIVVNAEGFVIQDSPELPGRIGLDVNDRDYFQQAKLTRKPVVTEPVMGRAALSPIFLLVQPIVNQVDEVVGYLFGSIRLADDNLLVNISNETIGDKGNLWVFDLERDLVVASSNKELAMQPISSLGKEPLIQALNQRLMQGEVALPSKGKILYTATPMSMNSWVVVHSFPTDLILNPVKNLLLQMFAVLALLTLIVGVITFFIIRHLVRPLKTSADQIASMLVSEEKIYPIPVIRRDEVGVLVSALNQLIEKQEIQASQLEVEKIKAEAASQAKSDFLANMSHEIRTPLNAIIGLSELQASADLPPEFSQRNEQIIRSSHLLLGIVNDLLDFSKIESGKMQMHRQPFAIDQIVDQLKILFSNQAISKGVELRFLLDEKLPQCLIGDNLRLTQILINLVSNALKFTEKGFVELSIQIMKPCDSSEDTGVKLHFRVRDTGIGIDKEHQKLLFASFSQADSSITRRHGGTGLGLAISKRLVELLGGDGINLESEPNVGSVFEFDLTFATCSEDEVDSIRTVQLTGLNHRSTKECRSFCGQHVLVVEDHPINQQMVKAQLERMGLKVSLADNGVHGVERVKAESFDLVLMDIQMPVMDGYRATEAIREFNTEIPIIALTAAALVEDKRKALDVGMNDHLGKPFSTEELYQQLVSWLETRPIASGTEKNATATESSLDTLDATLQQVESPFPVTMPVQKHKILIVDDMPANIKILASLLKDEYVVQVASKGLKAIEIASSQEPPDLILMDIMMPEMDGYEVCRTLKSNSSTSGIPIIFISALDEVSDEAKGLSIGAVDYITKPFHPDIVKARVRTHMDLKVKKDLLEKMSHIDGLTEVANRRSFDLQYEKELKRAQRNQQPLSLIMLDIDFFKPYNDHYGHGKGDECLIKVASELQSVICRPGDLFARYGGEEFVALLPETDAVGARKIAEAMRAKIDSLGLLHEYSAIADHVTMSAGFAVKQPNLKSGETLLEMADKALYRAKAAGRNQVQG